MREQENIDLVKRLRDAYPATQDMQHTLQGDLMDEAADAIEALQARVSELEAKAKSDAMDYLADTGQLMDRLETARRDAFEEAAKVAEHIMSDYAELTYSPHHDRMQNAAKTYCAGEIAAAIRALAEKG